MQLQLTAKTLIKSYFMTVFISLTGLYLVSCSTATVEKSTPWATRQTQLKPLNHFEITGKVAVKTPKEAGSANVVWENAPSHYVLTFSGPLGAEAMKLSGQPGLVNLQTSQGKQFTAKTPEELLAKYWGFQLPVSKLNYWIRGIPAPNSEASTRFDVHHRLSQLVQNGWHVEYLRYQTVANQELPNKIYLNSKEMSVKIIIYRWKLH